MLASLGHLKLVALAAVAATGMVVGTQKASAHDRLSFGISIGVPVYTAPAPVYVPPPAPVYAPAPSYVPAPVYTPAPTYVQPACPAPVVVAPAPVYCPPPVVYRPYFGWDHRWEHHDFDRRDWDRRGWEHREWRR